MSYGTNCPRCGLSGTLRCRCIIGETWCVNRHGWVHCPIHGTKIDVTGVKTHRLKLTPNTCWCRLLHKFTSGVCPPLTHCTDLRGNAAAIQEVVTETTQKLSKQALNEVLKVSFWAVIIANITASGISYLLFKRRMHT